LKARNAILKATGFVENHSQPVTIQVWFYGEANEILKYLSLELYLH
jgi:hypothetical protein